MVPGAADSAGPAAQAENGILCPGYRPPRRTGRRSARLRAPEVPVMAQPASPTHADPDEIARFDSLAATWWDPQGPMAPLHAMNLVRLQFIRDQVSAARPRRGSLREALRGVRALDIGCGAGLVTEPLARMGARVTGIDAAEAQLDAARRHAASEGLKIDYRSATVADLARRRRRFDLVTALELVEHVPDVPALLRDAAACLAPGGVFVGSTLNRTWAALAKAIVGAEYVLGLLPRGTHQFSKFVRPSEFAAPLRAAGLSLTDVRGLRYRVLGDRWELSDDVSVNYILAAVRPS